jgi:hypothetical protein
LRIGLPLAVVGIASAFAVVLARGQIHYEGIVEDVSAWGAFFTVFGVVYAIVAGFLLVSVLTRYGALSQTIEDELNAVESIRDFLVYFSGEQKTPAQAVNRSLATYAESVARVEWEEMADPAIPTNSDTSEELYQVMRSTGAIHATGERDNAILSAVIASVSDLAKMRTRRIALANERLPPRLRLLLLFMSFVLIASFLAVGVRSGIVHVFMTSSVSISAYLLYWIIADLDHPFYGFWNIDRSPLDDLIKRFEAEAGSAPETAA